MRISGTFRILPVVALATIAALVAACSGDPTATPTQAPLPTPTATAAPTATPTSAPVATATPTVAAVEEPTVVPATRSHVTLVAHETLGNVLADSAGNVLYLFTNDERDTSNCSGDCLTAWPPLMTDGTPQAGDGVNADRLGVIQTATGTSQVTYNGWPLYYFANDTAPGEANGQDRGDVWYVVSAFGGPIFTAARVNLSTDGALGPHLVDNSGRVQYLYARDEKNVSNCSGNCALAWPPLLSVDAPIAGEGVTADRLGATVRADGSKQVTYNGWPLYLYANDEKPGDTVGQARGDVWYLLNAAGGMVTEAIPQPVASSIANFSLQDLTITVGQTVRWSNADSAPHTTTSGGPGALTGVWDSATLTQGQSFDFTFTEAGVFQYFCIIHPSMTATATVTAP